MRYYLKILLSSALLAILIDSPLYSQFQGYHVQHFNSENGLPNTIKGIRYDTIGYVWLATESGLVRFDGTSFERYSRSEKKLSVNRLAFIDITSYGRIYVKADDNMFYCVGNENILHPIDPIELFKNDTNFHFIPATTLRLYNNCKRKYFQKQADHWVIPSLKKISRSYATSVGCSNGFFYYLNEQDELIIADTLLTKFRKPVLVGLHSIPTNPRNTPIVASIFQTRNQVYLRMADYIYELRPSQNKDTVSLIPTLPVGNLSNIIGIFPLTGQQTFIVASLTDGIYVYRKQFFSSLLQKDREENIYYAQAPWGRDGVLTNKGILTPDNFTPLDSIFDSMSILKAADGTYFIYERGLQNLGIMQLDASLKALRFMPSNKNLVRCFKQLNDGSIWFCADSLFLAKIEKDSVRWMAKPKDFPPALNVTTFMEIDQNTFWVAGERGMAKVNLATGKVEEIHELRNVNVRTLYKDDQNVIWICTYGNGLYALKHDKLISLPLDKERYLEYSHTIMPDKSGYFWITTNHGLFQVKQTDMHAFLDTGETEPYYYYYDNTAGFLSNEFNGGCYPAGIALGNGKFSFPSLKGLVQFSPDSLHPVLPDANIYIDHVIADTTTINPSNDTYNISNKTHYLQIYISSPYFGNPYNQRLQYHIDATDNIWHDIANGKIELGNFKKGNHSIFIRKRAGFGANNYITKKIDLFIQPRFYQTLFFKLLFAGFLLFTFYILIKLRTRLLIRQKKKLQQEVLRITQEQDLLIEDLEHTVAQLEKSKEDLHKTAQFKQILALVIAHDLQSPLRFLSDAMERLPSETKQFEKQEFTELVTELKNTSNKLHHFVEDFVAWIKKANIDDNLDARPVNISQLLTELNTFFIELSKNRQNKIIIKAPADLFVRTDFQILKLMLRNIIDNANKHTKEGTISIEVFAAVGTASITITDTGKGMSPEIQQRLKDRIQSLSPSSFNGHEGMGFGYRFIIDFCRLAGINLTITSEPNKGTSVVLSGLKAVYKT